MARSGNTLRFIADRLPWAPRRMALRALSFVEAHGFSALVVAKPNFRGIHTSFAGVPGSIGAIASDLAEGAVDNLKAERLDPATNFPLLDQHRELLPTVVALLAKPGRRLDILDFGGAAGVDFRNLRNAVPDLDVSYRVVDLAEVCEAARKQWRDEPRISFQPALPEQGPFDLVYSWSALQYVPDPLALLRRFADYRPHAILVVGSPFTLGKAFVREQVRRASSVPQWVLSLPDVKEVLASRGYRLALHAVHEHDYNVDGYPAQYRVPNSTSLLFLSNEIAREG